MNLLLGKPLAYVYVTEGYGHQREGRNHGGLDLRAPVGTPAYAVSSGKVIFGGQYKDGSGGAVELDHGDGIITRYLHLSRVDVKAGQSVSKGQRLGLTGYAVSPHLHWDAWVITPKLPEYVRRFGTPKGGLTQTKTWSGRGIYVKVPGEPLVPADGYQADVIAMAKSWGVPLYQASSVKALLALALVGGVGWAVWRYLAKPVVPSLT